MSEIIFSHVTHRFETVTALNDLSLTVPAGSFAVLIGPSGCGKTTALRLIAGHLAPSEGAVLLDGADAAKIPTEKRNVAAVSQEIALYPNMTVFANMAFPLEMRHAPKNEIRTRIFDMAELLDIRYLLNRKPRQLSLGQRQRVAIGRALLRTPGIFLFDEPFSNLDPETRSCLRLLLKRLHAQVSSTFVCSTHDQQDAMALADQLILLRSGRLVQSGAPAELYARPATAFAARFLGVHGMNLLECAVEAPGVYSGLIRLLPEAVTARRSDVFLGIRPEAVSSEPTDERCARLELAVKFRETLGAHVKLSCDLGGAPFVAILPQPCSAAQVSVYVPSRALYTFDAETGARIWPQ